MADKEKSPVTTKKATTVRTLKEKPKEEIAAVNEKESPAEKKNAFSTHKYRDISWSSVDPTKKLFRSFQDKKNSDDRTPREKATEKFKRSLDPKIATIFSGIITGTSKLIDPDTGKAAYFFIVNCKAGLESEGYQGRLIRIPLANFFIPLASKSVEQITEATNEEKILRYMTSRVGSEVEFTIVAMDERDYESGFITGSRKSAAKRRRNKYWYGVTKVKGSLVNVLDEGSLVDGTVVAVADSGLYAEVFGVEVFVPASELTYGYIANAKDLFTVGKPITLVVSNIERTKDGKIYFDASHKKSFKNPIPGYMKEYRSKDQVRGTVTRIYYDETKKSLTAYANIEDKFEIRCTMLPGITHTPVVGDEVKIEIGDADIDEEKGIGRMWGVIMHIKSEYL
jgi:predicted RNA-binding protein with RPS1 domain